LLVWIVVISTKLNIAGICRSTFK